MIERNYVYVHLTKGEILTINSAKMSSIYPKVASAMAKMHKKVDLGPKVPKKPCMWEKLRMFLEQYPSEEEFSDKRQSHL